MKNRGGKSGRTVPHSCSVHLHGHGPHGFLLDDDGALRLAEDGGGAGLVLVALPAGALDVGDVEAAEVLDVVVGSDDGDVDVGAGAHVVEDAGGDGVADELLGLLFLEITNENTLQAFRTEN